MEDWRCSQAMPDRYRTSSLQQACTNPVGRELAVYDLRTRQRLWTATEAADVDQRELAILGGRLYYHAIGQRVACRDLSTGELLWENRDAKLLELLGDRVKETGALLISARGMAAQPSALYFAAAWMKHRVAIDPDSGKLLWSQPVGADGPCASRLAVQRHALRRWQDRLDDGRSDRTVPSPGGWLRSVLCRAGLHRHGVRWRVDV